MTILEKIKKVVSHYEQASLRDIYKNLPEYSKEIIRGTINRHVNKSKNKQITRVGRGIYRAVDTIKIERTAENSSLVTVTRDFKLINLSVRKIGRQANFSNSELDIFLKNNNLKEAVGQTSIFDLVTEVNYSEGKNFITGTKDFICDAVTSKLPFEFGKIHCTDAVSALSKIKSESIDCLITDPPYRVTSGGQS